MSDEKTLIFYFSGTGNSLKVAKDLCEQIKDSELIPIKTAINNPNEYKCKKIGFVFPVYSWGAPRLVLKFVEQLKNDAYYFAVTTCEGSAGLTLLMIDDALKKNNQKLSAGFIIYMPGNYIPMYGAKDEKKQKACFLREKERVSRIAQIVESNRVHEIERSNIFTNTVFSKGVYPLFMKQDYNKS